MNGRKLPLRLLALLVLCSGCGDEFTATLDVDMSACFVVDGKRGNGRPVGLDGDPATDGVCVAGLGLTPQTMCLAVRVGKTDLKTATLSYSVVDGAITSELSGSAINFPDEMSTKDAVVMAPFFLKEGATDCAAYTVDTNCAESESCLFAFNKVTEKVSGDKTITLRYGYGKGLTACTVSCSYAGTPAEGGAPPCWNDRVGVAEACDGVDNNCDGRIDEAAAVSALYAGRVYKDAQGKALEIGEACRGVGGCGIDEVTGGEVLGQIVCVDDPDKHPEKLATCCSTDPECPSYGALGRSKPEVCDGQGIDNDCDGMADEGFEPVTEHRRCGAGACQGGAMICKPSDPTQMCCDTEAGCLNAWGNATSEVCDGIDNDCDGQTDEDFDIIAGVPGAYVFSRPNPIALKGDCQGIGQCGAGFVVCAHDGLAACCNSDIGCVAPEDPGKGSEEKCDRVDNDCDGETDEDFKIGGGKAWVQGEQELELWGACQDEAGQCVGGQVVCATGGLAACCTAVFVEGIACPGQMGIDEICDGKDNDCDGDIDEDFPTKGDPCDPPGVCGIGQLVCSSNGSGVCCSTDPTCTGVPRNEVCNATAANPVGLDDDCDGKNDAQEGIYVYRDPDFPDRDMNLGDPCWGKGICNIKGIVECCPPGAACAARGTARCSVAPGGTATPALNTEYCNDLDDDCDGTEDKDEKVGANYLFSWKNAAGVSLPLGSDCGLGGTSICGVGKVVCSCPVGSPNCEAKDRVAVCSTMPGSPSSPALAQERCNGKDDNCDGIVPSAGDADEFDRDGDGKLTCEETGCFVCVDASCSAKRELTPAEAGADRTVAPDPLMIELCDGKDNDCDGTVDEGFDTGAACGEGQCAGGVMVCDPSDNKATCCSTMPGCLTPLGASSVEVCDGVDNDCKDGIPVAETRDQDGDGVPECGEVGCLGNNLPNGPDQDKTVHPAWTHGANPKPAADEVCDGKDNNCDGILPEGELDRDDDRLLYCEEILSCRAQDEPDGRPREGGGWDAEWGKRVRPSEGPELYCDGRDNDCDRVADEDFNLGIDALNCGACGAACALANTSQGLLGNICKALDRPGCEGPACCAVKACEQYFYNLNQLDADGCEYYCQGVPGSDLPSGIGATGIIDADCDGVDGDLERAIFVSGTTGDDSNDGTYSKPVATLAKALTMVTGTKDQILVAAGTYTITAPLVIPRAVGIYGGYCVTCGTGLKQVVIDGKERSVRAAPLGWKRTPDDGEAASLYETKILYTGTAGAAFESYAIKVAGLGGQEVILDRLQVTGTNVTAGLTGADASSVVLYVNGSTGVVLRDSSLTAGNGAAGTGGTAGAAVANGNAGSPGKNAAVNDPGYDKCSIADQPTGGSGGPAIAACSARGAGGAAGNGGVGGTTPQLGGKGIDGSDGGSSDDDDIAGGTGGNNDPAAVGGPGAAGPAGSSGDGGTSDHGLLGPDFLLPADGAAATDGQCGAGGGGGAGGKGGVKPVQDQPLHPNCAVYGASGGGGGSGGAGGKAGTPGKGGGGSIAVLLWNSSRITLEGANKLVTANAGKGGNCGQAGLGGAGGAGGVGGTVDPSFVGAGAGMKGGDGGKGGQGGYGGAGSGGPSVAIFANGVTSVWTLRAGGTTTFTLGNAGAAGTCTTVPGGVAPPATVTGKAGVKAQCFNGVTTSNCF
jgi:hypothetical protein